MPKARLIIPHDSGGTFPDLARYHVTSRVVHRQFLFEADEKAQFRVLMRMHERFSGCRVRSYCVMTDHFHLLLEVPPPPSLVESGFTCRTMAGYIDLNPVRAGICEDPADRPVPVACCLWKMGPCVG